MAIELLMRFSRVDRELLERQVLATEAIARTLAALAEPPEDEQAIVDALVARLRPKNQALADQVAQVLAPPSA